ncbi:hypothetical protein GCM10028801_45550 [Nocardioides maradonensis]
MTSTLTADAIDTQVVAYVKADTILTGFATAFAEACRNGIDVMRLAGHTTYHGVGSQLTLDSRAQQVAALTALLADTRAAEARARRYSLEADDAHEADSYRDAARAAASHAADIQQQIDELADDPIAVDLDAPFDVCADVLLKAATRLRECGNEVTQEEFAALKTVMPVLRIERRAGRFWASATVRVNTTDGVAELGPVEWTLDVRGHGAQTVRTNLSPGFNHNPASRKLLIHELKVRGNLTANAARTLANAPFTQLPHVVLHHACGDPYPDWVGDEWRTDAFGTWVTGVYTDPGFWWLGSGKYVRVSYERQALATYAASHPEFSHTDAVRDLPLELTAAIRSYTRPSAPSPSSPSRVRPWMPSLVETTSPSVLPTQASYRGVTCDCGNIASIVARVPEIPSDLLCDCLLAPGGVNLGMPADLRFPADYRALRMPQEDCIAALRSRYDQWVENPPARPRQLLLQTDRLTAGATNLELAGTRADAAISSPILRRLEQHGLLTHDGGRPRRWRYTALGAERARQLATTAGRT